MEKIGLPKGLVRYDTIRNIENSDKSIKTAFKILRPRTFYYLAILVIVGGVILYNLTFKPTLVLNVISDRNPMFVMLSDGTIRNGYTIKINNKTHENRVYNIKILGIKDIHLKTVGTSDLNVNNLSVEPDDVGSFKVFAGTKEDNLDISGKTKIQIIISDNKTGEIAVKNSIFISK
jgi:polyferredoxin